MDHDVEAGVRDAFRARPQPAEMQQDLNLGIRQLADIAVKALSPGINDPTTAATCVDRLAEVVTLLGNRAMPDTAHPGQRRPGTSHRPSRRLRARAVGMAFDQMAHYGAGDPTFVRHLLVTLGQVTALIPPAAVRRW
ncbi:MAG: DUF2254 family protein [Dehalococcoidia bacterium]